MAIYIVGLVICITLRVKIQIACKEFVSRHIGHPREIQTNGERWVRDSSQHLCLEGFNKSGFSVNENRMTRTVDSEILELKCWPINWLNSLNVISGNGLLPAGIATVTGINASIIMQIQTVKRPE